MSTTLSIVKQEQELQEKELEQKIKSIKVAINKKADKNDFPLDTFPPILKDMIDAYCNCYGSAIEHYALAMLSTAGSVIGNACWIQERNTKQPPLLYSAIVDLPGRGKTPIVNTILKPVREIEAEYRDEFSKAMEEYKQAINAGKEDVVQPKCSELILNNFTVEAVYKVLQQNPRGCLVFRDEIAGWLSSMNAYKQKGGDEEFWLEAFNGGMLKVNRKNTDVPLFVRNGFVSVLGTTQPGMIASFAEGNKSLNGFLSRILFAFPESTKSTKYVYNYPSHHYGEAWRNVVRFLSQLPEKTISPLENDNKNWSIEPVYVQLNKDATKLYEAFFNLITDKTNACEDDEVKAAMITKHNTHVLRIALILAWLDIATSTINTLQQEEGGYDYKNFTHNFSLEEMHTVEITANVMERAIKISKYFLSTSLKVVGRLGTPVERLKDNIRAWYESLPLDFDRQDAITLGVKGANMSERTIQRYLNNEKFNLFKRLRKGYYEKIYA